MLCNWQHSLISYSPQTLNTSLLFDDRKERSSRNVQDSEQDNTGVPGVLGDEGVARGRLGY